MNDNKIIEQIAELEKEISALPSGSITKKKIKDGIYYYHRINENGKRKENYIDKEKAEELKIQIERRKALQKELKSLKALLPNNTQNEKLKDNSFNTYVRIGETLKKYALPVKRYKKRDCFVKLKEYIYDASNEKVLILYGLRRTGKTTLIRQLIADMSDEDLSKSVFIQIKSSDTLASVNADLKKLEQQNYKYVFIDEVTLMRDFVEGAALFSDIFAASGMKIVLSGTDSLGFVFSEDEQLFDRAVMLHTTFISYREFENVLGVKGIDEYIRYGGTMSLGGINYNSENFVFANTEKTDEYIDSAIAKNIQHSLKHYQNGSHFRSLYSLYKSRELTSAINRVVEDMNHQFTRETLTRTFYSNDLSVSASNLRKDRFEPNDILDRVDEKTITESIKNALDILNIEEQTVAVSDVHATEIKEYLKLLDLVDEIDVLHIPNTNNAEKLSVITQPGMRYVQAEALAEGLLADKTFNKLNVVEKDAVLTRIKNEIKGRMMEEIVLLETKIAKPKYKVFKLQFAVGEFDMVIFNPEMLSCEIYEIKHSKEAVDYQYRHLTDNEKCQSTEHNFGKITGKYVIYRGESFAKDDINYFNVEEYLKSLQVEKKENLCYTTKKW